MGEGNKVLNVSKDLRRKPGVIQRAAQARKSQPGAG
jgi:hypothetical protein